MIAASFPLLDVFLTMLWIALFFLWFILLILVFADLFRSRDLSGWAKALWVLLIIVFPFGVLIYLIVRGGKMYERHRQSGTFTGLAKDFEERV